MPALSGQVRYIIEVPRFSLVKWGAHGGVDFWSPVPCPFNYGSAPEHIAEDGDPIDVIVLGPRLPRGHRGTARVVARVRFVDRGRADDKWVCGDLRRRDAVTLRAFFYLYARVKGVGQRVRSGAGAHGSTAFLGLEHPLPGAGGGPPDFGGGGTR